MYRGVHLSNPNILLNEKVVALPIIGKDRSRKYMNDNKNVDDRVSDRKPFTEVERYSIKFCELKKLDIK